MLAASEKLRNKACLWDKALVGNLNPSAYNIMCILASDGATTHVEFVLEEAAKESLTRFLTNL